MIQSAAMMVKHLLNRLLANLHKLPEEQLLRLRALLEREMKRRGLAFSVGEIGEQLVIDHFRRTPNLPKLQRSPKGTKNVDALSRDGDRYSIKTLWRAKKTGTVYPDPSDDKKQLFEYLLIAQLTEELTLKALYQFTWEEFARIRSWDKRMSAWYVGASKTSLTQGRLIYSTGTAGSTKTRSQ